MNATETMNAALISRGVMPLTFMCAKCGDTYGRDECAKDDFAREIYADIHNKFGGHVCKYCAHDVPICSQCEEVDVEVCPDTGLCVVCTEDNKAEAAGLEDLKREWRESR